MKRIKSFIVKAEPTNKVAGDLASRVDSVVNTWLAENPDLNAVEITHSADTKATFPEAFVIITYDVADEPARKKNRG